MKALKIIAAVLSGILIIVLIATFATKDLKIATRIAGGVFLFFLLMLIVVILRRRSYGSGSGAVNYGKIIMWVIILSVIGTLGLIAPKYLKKGWKEAVKTDTSTPIYAISEWKKKPEQYGTSPEKRRSGPMNTTITRRTGGVFNFKISYTDKNGNPRLAKFEGEYDEHPKKMGGSGGGGNISKGTKIVGTWRQNYPQDYGDWYLVSIDGDRLFEGWFSGKTGEQIPFFLKIKKN